MALVGVESDAGAAMNACSTEPLLILSARLGWKLGWSFIYGNGGENPPTEQVLKFIPALECGLELAGEHDDIVLDLKALFESARKPGGYFLLTCECGYADDADIKEFVFVQHPSPDTIVWEVDIQGLRSALIKDTWLTHQDGYVRLIFDRSQYVTDLRRMVAEVQRANKELELYELAGKGDYRFVEELLVFDFSAPIIVEAIFPPGSHLEFRLEGDEYCWLNGKKLKGWPPHYYPCWEINRAFKKWTQFFQRGYAGNSNQFYLMNEDDRVACDAVGFELVAILRQCLDESASSSEVSVSYSPCNVPVVSKR